jgi:hypothetical protein
LTHFFYSFSWSMHLALLPVKAEFIPSHAEARSPELPDLTWTCTWRSCFGTHCHDNGMPVEAVSKLLGHSKLSVTVRYTQVSTARMVQSYNAAHPHASRTAQVAERAQPELA